MIQPTDLSLIVTAYNIVGYLRACLASIDEAGGRQCPVILVDDGSSDGSLDLLRELCSERPGTRLLTTPHLGPGGARNAGLDECRTPYLMFVDGDDLLVTGAIPNLCSVMAPGVDFVLSNRQRFRDWDGQVRPLLTAGDVPACSIRSFPPRMLRQITIHGRVYSAAFLSDNDLRFPEGIYWEDIVFTQRTYSRAETIASTAAITYRWRVRDVDRHGASVTQSRLSAHSIRSRFVQMQLSVAVAESAEWKARFDEGPDWSKELGARFLNGQLRPLAVEAQKPEARAQVLELIDVINEHAPLFQPHLPDLSPRARACWSAVMARDVDRLASLSWGNPKGTEWAERDPPPARRP